MVLVDSSIWIEASRAKGDLVAKVAIRALLHEYEVLLCGPVRLEVLGGARRDERKKWAEHFAVLPYRPVREPDWSQAIQHAWQLKDSGITAPWNDILIATLAKQDNVRIYSADKHFTLMQPVLGLRLYSPGPGGRYVRESEIP
jgi:predicted nucleic acid-binding protein